MECNRDEAKRAKEIAENKFSKNDILGARKFALKAQSLYPGLDGIFQFLAILNVYVAVENKINGELDCYGILGVNPSTDDETLKKHYKKLAFSLHPDKNKCIGAEGAFQYVSQAWNLLSDKNVRSLYDHRRNGGHYKQNVQTQNSSSQAPKPPTQNGGSRAPKQPAQNGGSRPPKPPAQCGGPQPPKPPTQYGGSQPPKPPTQYGGSQAPKPPTQNAGSQVPKSRTGNGVHSIRKRKAAPTKLTSDETKTRTDSFMDNVNADPKLPTQNSFHSPTERKFAPKKFTSFETKTKSDSTGDNISAVPNMCPPTVPSAGHCMGPVPLSVPSLGQNIGPVPVYVPSSGHNMGPVSVSSTSSKRVTPKTFWTVCKRCKLMYEFLRKYLNQNLLCPTCHGPFHATEYPPPNIDSSEGKSGWNPVIFKTIDGELCHGLGSGSKVTKPSGLGVVGQAPIMGQQQANVRGKREREEAQEATQREEALRRKISKKEAQLSSKKSNSVKTKQDGNGSGPFGSNNETGPVEVKKDVSNMGIKDQLIKKATMEIKKKLNEWNAKTVKDSMVDHSDVADGELENQEPDPLVTDVPDPDFHDFDHERTEKCFEEGQVWAAYDDHDGMPRLYAMIKKVISLKPFKMKVCWLSSKYDNPGPFPGFLKAFGEFKAGKHETVSVPNYFSHKANFKKQANGNIRVFLKKGDVCALYRNKDQTSDLVRSDNYEIVEINEYDEETGTTVTPLTKVWGFNTVFRRHHDPKETRVVLKNELFRFSHQIPSCLLSGQESANAPKGCIELDPAAVPPEFLQVTENVDEAEKVKVKDGQTLVKDRVFADIKEAGNVEDGK